MSIENSHPDRSASNRHVKQATGRIDAIDIARGVALAAMTSFHFGWDLEMFAMVERGFASQPAMIWYARIIAASFLFLVGVSFVLAHGNGLHKYAFLRRLAMIVAAAGLITAATWFATPQVFIFFGILHHIALATILAVFFVRLSPAILLAIAVVVLALPQVFRTPLLDDPWWWWTGLSEFLPRSSDYVPVFPFFAAVLAGLASGKWMVSSRLAERLAIWRPEGRFAQVLRFMGRNSLAYYLVHQPVLIAILLAFQWVAGLN